ncbi:MAG: DNA polymerase-3 subunit beta [Pelagibacterales bacterium]|nr:DNA polymerase-3 subunit beta [Pelagibacterales bacterium]|tara:strand:+ start:164 stop:1279 length:1116 start_codon:yes stop_codon:yes gene_type:complete
MQFTIKRDALLKSLNLVQGVIEKKNTLPILSNVLIHVKNNTLTVIATDLDLIFYDEINNIKVVKEGSTTTSATVLYDILRKVAANSDINFDLKSENKLNLKSDSSNFNLLCLPADNFPNFSDDFNSNEIILDKFKLLSLLNKTKISISSDDTRHYLNGVFLHTTNLQDKSYLTAVATDSHRLSSSSIEIEKNKNFNSLILPKKTVFQLCTLLQETNEKVMVQTSETKIQFKIGKIKLISKLIDGKFPDYTKVVPTDNDKLLMVGSKEFIDSVERVTTISLDRKEGVKLVVNKDSIQLSVNSTSSGDGNEIISAKYSSEEITISFNSKYLIDIASEVEDKNLKIKLKDSTSPVLIEDNSDKNSYYVIMPMKI